MTKIRLRWRQNSLLLDLLCGMVLRKDLLTELRKLTDVLFISLFCTEGTPLWETYKLIHDLQRSISNGKVIKKRK